MGQFRLKREYPAHLEITVTSKQLISMFPIEIQEHPFMGIISRVWRTSDQVYSVENIPPEHITDLSGERKYLKVKDQYMSQLLSALEKFEIVLFYEDREDIYQVERITD
ncbi:hypothetical protein GWK41_09075 [Persephonella atlantica]|uniref:Uncharacterized protein n=1 Tax=Persephonella atlantica TaxID=2699429 RepID=A0ABS1GJX2_9AQUI|nr:hypothetical protein [Persephonella atlantica]MBK3333220.1 hypothetical protein [Persephonella atlantica]